ncbi:MAG TPA: peroxidase family protein [Geminicoccus sp.]|jgi:hypothetical protein|uniref:peroxidase family protein n=1 Tax=Geminicoccus sp. TaxID=2024832 RepID=UPI002E35A902|nr:peroxidase family protein [Geminicoccus sp.]HEX2528400.1 peroxidase family protein [Geminicoccus sp.]
MTDHLDGQTAKPASNVFGHVSQDQLKKIALERTSSADPRGPLQVPSVPAGYTYFGQLLAHDLSVRLAGVRSQHGREGFFTLRGSSAALELETLYGQGVPQEGLFIRHPQTQTLCKFDVDADDIARTPVQDGPLVPVLADPRNDDNWVLAQLTFLFMTMHNKIVDAFVRVGGMSDDLLLPNARHVMVAIFRQVIFVDYLKRLLDPPIYTMLMDTQSVPLSQSLPPPLKPHVANITQSNWWIELPLVCGRIGHAMVRGAYTLNEKLDEPALLLTLMRDQTDDASMPWPPDLQPRKVNWRFFFEVDPKNPPQAARPITPFIYHTLAKRKVGRGGDSLSDADLTLSCTYPSGQDCARHLNQLLTEWGFADLAFEVLEGQRMRPAAYQPERFRQIIRWLDRVVEEDAQFCRITPLGYYLLQEAAVHGDGAKLGRLGSFILAHGLHDLRIDPKVMRDLAFMERQSLVTLADFIRLFDQEQPDHDILRLASSLKHITWH